MNLIINLLKIRKKMTINQMIEKFHLNEEELLVLYHVNILIADKRYLTNISKLALISKSKTSLIIEDLVKKNYLNRLHLEGNEDRRISQLELTFIGRDILEKSLNQIYDNFELYKYKPETIDFFSNLIENIGDFLL